MYLGYVYFSLLELLPYFFNLHYCLSLQRVWFCLRFFLFYGGEGPTLLLTPPHPHFLFQSLRSICPEPGCFPGASSSYSLNEVAFQPWQIAVISGILFVSLPGLDLIFARCQTFYDLCLKKIFLWWKCPIFYQTENVLGYKIPKWKLSIQPLSIIPFSLLSVLQASNVVLFGWFFWDRHTV